MCEEFSPVFTCDSDLYRPGGPVRLCAGALLRGVGVGGLEKGRKTLGVVRGRDLGHDPTNNTTNGDGADLAAEGGGKGIITGLAECNEPPSKEPRPSWGGDMTLDEAPRESGEGIRASPGDKVIYGGANSRFSRAARTVIERPLQVLVAPARLVGCRS